MSKKATTPATTTPTVEKKSASITLRANGSIMLLVATRTEHGATTTVSTKAGKERAIRGMTERHKTFEAATARLDVLAKDATSKGWTRGTFKAAPRPDAFDSLPAAPTAPSVEVV